MRHSATPALLAPTLLVGGLLLATPAAAHSFGAHGAGLVAGFTHPLGGLDHLLAMLGVGLWASQLGGRARWAVPAAFLAALLGGAALGAAGLALPMVEAGIALSVLLAGAALALAWRPALPVALGLAGLFAALHGHAHGTEAPAAASLLAYGAGFMAGTALLLGAGLAAGRALAARSRGRALRLAGGLTGLTGLVLLGSTLAGLVA